MPSRIERASTSTTHNALEHWRVELRPSILRAAVGATKSLSWSPSLLNLLFEELYVGDSLETLLNTRLRQLQQHRYPEAIATGLILRHSWHPNDLASVVKRLGLRVKADRSA